MEDPKFCFDLVPVVCATYSIDIPVWELLITVLVTAAVTAVTIRWSVGAARRETMRAIRANAKAEVRARRDRATEISNEIARSERRERSALVGTLMSLVTQRSKTWLLAPKNERRLESEAAWNATRATFEASPLPDAYRLFELADLRIKQAVKDRARADKSATEFLLSSLFVDEIRRAAMEWVQSGQLSQRSADALEKLEAEDNAERAKRIEALLQRVGAMDFLETADEIDSEVVDDK